MRAFRRRQGHGCPALQWTRGSPSRQSPGHRGRRITTITLHTIFPASGEHAASRKASTQQGASARPTKPEMACWSVQRNSSLSDARKPARGLPGRAVGDSETLRRFSRGSGSQRPAHQEGLVLGQAGRVQGDAGVSLLLPNRQPGLVESVGRESRLVSKYRYPVHR